MQGIIFDLKRYAIHDGPGIRTTVFMQGCLLHCRWCHNPESQPLRPTTMHQVRKIGDREFEEEATVGYEISADELMGRLMKDKVFFEESGGGVTFSGGEPLVQAPFLLEMLKRCKAEKIHTCVDTAGAVRCPQLEEICKYTDLFLYDLKTGDEKVFQEYIGEGYKHVLKNLDCIVSKGNRVLMRIPVIPEVNNTPEGIEALLSRLKKWPTLREVDLLPYHRTGADKYRRLGRTYDMGDTKSLTENDIEPMKERFRREGLGVR